MMKKTIFPILFSVVVFMAGCGSSTKKQATTEANKTEAKKSEAKAPNKQKPNPYLSAEFYATTHFTSGQSDAFPYEIPTGNFNIDLRKFPRFIGGPTGYIQMFSTDPKYMWATTTGSVAYVDVSNNGWKVVAEMNIPGVPPIPADAYEKGLSERITSVKQAEDIVKSWKTDWTHLTNNIYVFVDKDNVLYGSTKVGQIMAYGLKDAANPAAGIKVLRTLDFSKTLKEVAQESTSPILKKYGANIVGASLTYDGNIVILSSRSVSIVDREFKNEPKTITFGTDEFITNSMAIDENNGIYVASDKLMHKVVWTGTKLSSEEADGAWSSPYDYGQEPPSVKFGTGTGATPTLMGFGDDEDKLVVITDGANRMNLVAFWCNEIPAYAKQQEGTKSNRIAGQIPITCGLNPLPEFIQSEQSVVVDGYGAFVVNNIRPQGNKDKLVDVLCGGPVFAPSVGAERCEWDTKTHSWKSVWTRNDVVSTSMVPAVSTTSDIVVVNGYTSKDGWEVTGMDWNTGKTVTRVIFGQDNLGNGAYALLQYLPNGDLLFNSIGGPIRVKLK